MDAFRQDLSYALRRLWAAPGFTLVAVLTLALGIGANAALFSIVNGVLLRPLPYPHPDRLLRVVGLYEGKPVVMSPANFLDVRAAATTLEGLAAYDNTAFTLTGGAEPHRVEATEVSANFFDVLGVRPALGRGFEGGENDPGRAKVVVLGHGLWAQRFAGDPGVLGQAVVLDGQPYTVVGVAAAGFGRLRLSGHHAALGADAPRCPVPPGPWGGLPRHGGAARRGRVHRAGARRAARHRRAPGGAAQGSERGPRHGRDPLARPRGRGRLTPADAAPGRRWLRAPHRLRQRREPVAGPACGPRPRARGADGTGRGPRPDRAPAPHRGRGAGRCRRRPGHGGRLLGTRAPARPAAG